MRRVFWIVVVLALLVVGADRGGDYAAEQVVASSLQTTQVLDSKPDVDITGIPFLTQFAAGRYPKVVVTVDGVKVADSGLRIDTVTLTFRDVTASKDFTTFRAQDATALATVGYATLKEGLGADVTYAGGGRVRVDRTVRVLGKHVPVQVTAEPRVADGVLTLVDPKLAKDLPSGVSIDLDEAVHVRIPVTGLPFKLTVDAVSARADGVVLALTGKDLAYQR